MSRSLTLGAILRATLLAAVFASMLTAAFHSLVTEPVIDQAIALEEQHQHALGMPEEEPAVSRPAQKLGLILGWGIYGLTFGLLFAAAYQAARGLLPAASEAAKGLWVTVLAYGSVVLLPALKSPANPPGQGDPETIGYRQALFLGLMLLGVVGSAAAIAAAHRFGPSTRRALLASALTWLVAAVMLVGLLPPSPDALTMDAGIVMTFRQLSLAGLTLFWLAFAVLFSWMVSRRTEASLHPAPTTA